DRRPDAVVDVEDDPAGYRGRGGGDLLPGQPLLPRQQLPTHAAAAPLQVHTAPAEGPDGAAVTRGAPRRARRRVPPRPRPPRGWSRVPGPSTTRRGARRAGPWGCSA